MDGVNIMEGKLKCIALAMGYDNTEGDGDTF
jgi:hypothetical protein